MDNRCVYEMHVAQKLNVKVKLSPHIKDSDVERVYLYNDVCIKNINIAIDSEHAKCSWDPDKQAIHLAIQSESTNGFGTINASVEKIRLDYLLD